MHGSGKVPVARHPGHGKSPGRTRWTTRWLHFRWRYLVLAALLALVSTGVAFTQQPWPDVERSPEGGAAWLYPSESNAWLRVTHGSGVGASSSFQALEVVGRKVILTLDSGALSWSDDGGWTWRSDRLPDSGHPVALAFQDEAHGYALTKEGQLHETLDGGTSWKRLVPEEPRWPRAGIRDLALGGDGSLWLLTDLSVWYRGPQDTRWSEEVLVLPALIPAGPTYRLSVSRDGSEAWISTEGGALRVVRSGDRLITSGHESDLLRATPSRRFQERRSWWVQGKEAFSLEGGRLNALPLPEGAEELTDIQFLADGRRGWVLGKNGWLARTSDGGATWESLRLPRASNLRQLRMAEDGKTGWFQGEDALWRTDDGGRTAYLQVSRSRALTASLRVAGRSELWAGTSTGALLHSTDGGVTWSSRALDAPVLWLGAMRNGEVLLALTGEGLWRSLNGGTTWEEWRDGRFVFAHFDLERDEVWLFERARVLRSSSMAKDWSVEEEPAVSGRYRELAGASTSVRRFSGRGLESFEVSPSRVSVAADPDWLAGDAFKSLEGSPALKLPTNLPEQGLGFHLSESRGWAFGRNGRLFSTKDGGKTWTREHAADTSADLFLAVMTPDAKHVWLFGDEDTLLRSEDGGRSWVRVRNERSLPHWYFVSWLGVVVLGWVGLGRAHSPSKPEASEAVADLLITDTPIEHPKQDVLGLAALAQGLSNFIRNERTLPPLTLAVTGEWGTGKSSVLNLLRTDLVQRGFRPVWFNAWHNQQEDNLLAALYSNIISQCVPQLPGLEALEFRLRLLLRRGARLVFLLIVLLIVVTWSVAFFLRNPQQINLATERLAALPERVLGSKSPDALSAPSDTAPTPAPKPEPVDDMTWPTLFGSLTSLVMLAQTLLKGFKSFGVDPAHLLASVESRARLEDYRERVSFQARFAEDFKDVTEALGPRRMVILIDDLDRCSPENVVKMLEAINFLVSSGKCFVVMAISRRVVEEYVGQQLGDAADNLAPLVVPPLEGPAPTEEQVRHARRIAYARHYLEKLINVELPVPPLTEERVARLSEERAQDELVSDDARRRTIQRVKVLVFGALALALAATLGWHTQVPMLRPGKQAPAPVAVSTPPAVSPPAVATPAVATPAVIAPVGGSITLPAPAPDRSGAGAPIDWSLKSEDSADAGPWTALLWVGVVLALLLARGHALFPRDVVVRDSQPFTDSLDIWRPVIMLRHRTPRSIKRFLNRVRFFAMCQRALLASEAPGEMRVPMPPEGVIPAFVGWLRALPAPMHSPPAMTGGLEHHWVAFAALHEFAPEALTDPGFYLALQEEKPTYCALPIPPEVHASWRAHLRHFNEGPPPAEALHSFQRLSGSVKVQ
ncbi:MAG TPA: P-loop NTPase fold protein [Archangium sp.]|jgi:photosystem II stability/assembly factor-like uncharacterized protein|uniref:P-loop NTPase fold protein n=1 Tax=Archangium sp. TaxID=1872627 RepID=UPI002ED978B9